MTAPIFVPTASTGRLRRPTADAGVAQGNLLIERRIGCVFRRLEELCKDFSADGVSAGCTPSSRWRRSRSVLVANLRPSCVQLTPEKACFGAFSVL